MPESSAQKPHQPDDPTHGGERPPSSDDYGVPYLPAPPPSAYGFATFFRSDPSAIRRSREAIMAYRTKYDNQEQYSLRLRTARATGLPATLNGMLDAPAPLDMADQAIEIATAWLSQDVRTMALFGIDPTEAKQRLQYIEHIRSYPSALDGERDKRPITTHIRYQQWHQERWPVFGGTVVVHLVGGDRRASVSNSYFPIPADTTFSPSIDQEIAIKIARQAATRHSKDAAEWSADVVAYAKSELFILPFAGRYYLAYQIELCSPTGDQALRIFVDASKGYMLGQPEDLVAHMASFFPTSQAALDNAGQALPLSGPALSDAIAPFMILEFHPDAGGGAVDLVAITAKANPTDVEQEAIEIAFHAQRMYQHFRAVCGADEHKLQSYTSKSDAQEQQPGLKVMVGKGGQQLDMGFNNAAAPNPKPIAFQTAGNQGLLTGGLIIHNPARDPEVIMHEIVHGLMWLLNSAPFDLQNASVPFGRALVEGYANYFARSLAERQDAASNLWGRAAYQKDAWGQRWSVARNSQQVGSDLLPAPNLYPGGDSIGLPIYDVGMIWARALWEIRALLGDRDLADRLALEAYQYVHGWVSNFEIAAEGLIDAARKAQVANAQVDEIIAIFARRGILAERGVQALAQARTSQGKQALLVGTDAGLTRSDDDGATWQDWSQRGGSPGLTGVIALAVAQPTIYAATEEGVFARDILQANSAWAAVGNWPAEEYPYALTILNGVPYVGSGHGVLRLEQGDWQRWESQAAPFEDLALDLAAGAANISTYIYIANMRAPQLRATVLNVDADWSGTGDLPFSTAITIVGGFAYAGTLAQGVWKQPLDAGVWEQIAKPVDLHDAAVLAVRALPAPVGAETVFAATTAGLFHGNAIGGWQPVAGAPLDIITDVLPVNGLLLIGTASQGVLVLPRP